MKFMYKKYPQKPNPFEGLKFDSKEWANKLGELTKFKLDTLEEYEEKSADISDDADYYEFWKFMDTCSSVWMIDASAAPPLDSRQLPFAKMIFSTAGKADRTISKRAERRKISAEDIPIIPILEYKLVPTGFVEYYDATISPKSREKRRYLRGERGMIAKANEKAREKILREEAKKAREREKEENED